MSEATKQLPAPTLTGPERAAMVLRELGEETAAAVLRADGRSGGEPHLHRHDDAEIRPVPLRDDVMVRLPTISA